MIDVDGEGWDIQRFSDGNFDIIKSYCPRCSTLIQTCKTIDVFIKHRIQHETECKTRDCGYAFCMDCSKPPQVVVTVNAV